MPAAIQVQIDKLNALIGGGDAATAPLAPAEPAPVPTPIYAPR